MAENPPRVRRVFELALLIRMSIVMVQKEFVVQVERPQWAIEQEWCHKSYADKNPQTNELS
jgi:hypothetical protein